MGQQWKLNENDRLNCSITSQWKNHIAMKHDELETSNIKNVYDLEIL